MGSTVRTLGKPACLGLALLVGGLASAASAAAAPPRPLPPLVAAADDALTRELEAGRLSEAQYALQRARSLFQLGKVRARFGEVERAGGRDATLILRDLAVRRWQLTGSERATAERLLARPTDGDAPFGNGYSGPSTYTCGPEMCFHWATGAGDPGAPQPADTSPANGIPDWVDTTRATFEYVWGQEVDTIGYRTPLDDSASNQQDVPAGPDEGKLDIYLDELGGDGVFGYCASDDPNTGPAVYAVSAYCVVDNDYSAVHFGTSQTPEGFLQVTAAHEFSHAVQFAYDWFEDYWLLEGTATNMERTVYPAVRDNISFLRSFSPLSRPWSPLDRGGFGDSEYGSWIFWRFVEEKLAGNDPTAIRKVWERADAATPLARDEYSLLAVRRVLNARHIRFTESFAQFGIANRLRDYEDGGRYPKARRSAVFGIGPRAPTTGWRSVRLDHLTNRFYVFAPGSRVRNGSRLRVRLDLTAFGSEATLLVFRRSGTVIVRRLALSKRKDGTFFTQFDRNRVKRVELALSNASFSTSCWEDFGMPPFYSCFGDPRDDRRIFRFKASLVP